MICFFYSINFIKVLIFSTFLIASLFLNKGKKLNQILFLLIFVNFFTEIFNSILICNTIPIRLSASISIIIHNIIWLYIIQYKKKITIILIYLSFSIFNLFFIENCNEFNYNSFIVGAITYSILFVYKSFYELKKENLVFFTSNNYILLCVPVLFFIGLSFMFAFQSKQLTLFIVFGNIKLYTLINYFVNIIYYSLINLYIYKERKLQNAT